MENQNLTLPPERAGQTSLSLFFVLIFGAIAVMQPYLNLYYQYTGFTGVQIGLVATISSLVVILVAPQYGNLYDHSANKRSFLILTMLATLISLGIVPFTSAFVSVVVLYSVYRVISTSNISAAHNLAFHAGSSQLGNNFGGTRLWGSLGYSIFVLIGGWVFERMGIKVNAIVYVLLCLSVVFVLFRMPGEMFKQEPVDSKTELSLSGVLKLVIGDRYLWLMMLALALTDPVMDGVRSFEPVYMKELGLSESIIGISGMLAALLEIPLMLSVDRLIKKYGYHKVTVFVFVFDLLRRMIVWFFPYGSSVFTMTVLNSVSFPLRLYTMVSLVNQRIPKQYTTTALNFVSVTLTGLGYMLSNALSGLIYDRFGGQQVFLFAAVLCASSLLLALIANNSHKPLDELGA